MNARRLKTGLLAAGVGLAPLACIDDPSAVSDDPIPLSRAEAELLGLGLFRDALEVRVAASTDTVLNGALRGTKTYPMAAGVPVSAAIDTTLACGMSGTIYVAVSLTGDVDAASGSGVLDMAFLKVHRDCREMQNSQVFMLRGAPSITTLFRLVSDGAGTIDLLGTISGGVEVTVDGRRGMCDVALAFTGRETPTGSSVTLKGTACDQPVDETTQSSG